MDTVLFVDDEPNVAISFRRQLRGIYEVLSASSGKEALTLLAQNRQISIIVTDMQMPEMNGVQLLKEVNQRFPDIIRVILTGNNDQQTVVKAINEGDVFRFLNKPCSTEQIINILQSCAKQYQAITAEKDLLQNTLSGTIKLLTDLYGMVDPDGYEFDVKVRERTRVIAKAINLKGTLNLELASMLCNIGRFSVPSEILNKEKAKATLSQVEEEILSRHPEIGATLVRNIPRLETVSEIILHHRKKKFNNPQNTSASKESLIASKVLQVSQDIERQVRNGSTEAQVITHILQTDQSYSPELIKALVDLYKSPAENNYCELKDYEVNLDGLVPGQIITEEVKTKTGTLLLNKGFTVTQAVIAKLKNYEQIYGLNLPIHVNTLMPISRR